MVKKTALVLGREVSVEASVLGADLNVTVYGGDAPHMGGIALAIPYLSAGKRPSAYLSSLSVPGHKDEVLWRTLAKALAVEHDTKVVVSGGVHFEGLPPEELPHVSEAIGALASEAARAAFAK